MLPADLQPNRKTIQFEEESRKKLKSNISKRHAEKQLPDVQSGEEYIMFLTQNENATISEQSTQSEEDMQEVKRIEQRCRLRF